MTDQVTFRRAIEALRAGVPNRDAVGVLGAHQPEIEVAVRERYAAVSESHRESVVPAGIVIAGVFGTGKSHLLEYLRHQALEQDFVCSRLAVSKETPIYDLPKVLRNAIAEMTIPQRRDRGLAPVANRLQFDSPDYSDFFRWVNSVSDGLLDTRFAATLYLYEYDKGDEEFRERIVGFWSGYPLSAVDLKKKLREHGQASTYPIGKAPKERDLSQQRALFAAQLARAAGYRGWILLLDELELISSYSRLQRARSYAELARWGNRILGETIPGILAIMAITPDVVSYLFDEKRDRDEIPNLLSARGDEGLAAQAERGMRLIERERLALRPPDRHVLQETYQKIREIYTWAYGWQAPGVQWPEQLSSTPMREYIRFWINQWDLQRAYPGYVAQTEITPVQPDYSENPDVESGPDETDAGYPE